MDSQTSTNLPFNQISHDNYENHDNHDNSSKVNDATTKNCSARNNNNSTRAFSRKNRVYAMREFILQTYSHYLKEGCTILDVAGGKGVLSWLLTNIDGYDSIVCDPRRTDYTNLMKSVTFLQNNPAEAELRCQSGLATFQPLAACLKTKRLKSERRKQQYPQSQSQSQANGGLDSNNAIDMEMPFVHPRHLRMYIDATLIEALQSFLQKSNLNDSMNWETFWEKATQKAEQTCPIYGSKQHLQVEPMKKVSPPEQQQQQQEYHVRNQDQRITNAETARSIFFSKNTQLIVGFHPDQATEATIDLALLFQIPFVVCPCCVFPSEFPNRFLPPAPNTIDISTTTSTSSKSKNVDQGIQVKKYAQLLEYLKRKHPNIRMETIDMMSSTAKNIVLYMLPEDFT